MKNYHLQAAQFKAILALIGIISVRDLARKSSIAVQTLYFFFSGRGMESKTFARIWDAIKTGYLENHTLLTLKLRVFVKEYFAMWGQKVISESVTIINIRRRRCPIPKELARRGRRITKRLKQLHMLVDDIKNWP